MTLTGSILPTRTPLRPIKVSVHRCHRRQQASSQVLDRRWDEVNEKRSFPTSAPRALIHTEATVCIPSFSHPWSDETCRVLRMLPRPILPFHRQYTTQRTSLIANAPTQSSHAFPPRPTPIANTPTAHSSSTDSPDMIYPDLDQPYSNLQLPPNLRISSSESPLPLPPH